MLLEELDSIDPSAGTVGAFAYVQLEAGWSLELLDDVENECATNPQRYSHSTWMSCIHI